MSEEKKIALFLPSLRGGGAERMMVYLANGFAERGFLVDLILVKAEGPYLSLVSNQVRIFDFKCTRTLTSLPRLVSYLKSEKPDAILSTLDHANAVAIIASFLAGRSNKIVVRVANNISARKGYSRNIRGWLTLFLIKYVYSQATNVIAISQGIADDLVKSYGVPRDKVKTIYNPAIMLDVLCKAEEKASHPWLYPGQLPVILGVGRLTTQKDFASLIQAFAIVVQQYSSRLIILGEGEERKKLESIVENLKLETQVSLPGFVDNPFAYMRRASVFVFSSRWEGFGNVLVEAMACGTPVVSTDCPSGPSEILEDGKWGHLIPVGDIEAMAQAMIMSLNGQVQCPSVEMLEHRFGLASIVDQYLSILL